jgi:hypothetical protein
MGGAGKSTLKEVHSGKIEKATNRTKTKEMSGQKQPSYLLQVRQQTWSDVFAEPMVDSPSQQPLCHGLRQFRIGPFKVMLAETMPAAELAVTTLLDSLQDQQLGFDLEWKPEFSKGQTATKVAMMQLSGGNLCVLLRVCLFGFRLPQVRCSQTGVPLSFRMGYGTGLGSLLCTSLVLDVAPFLLYPGCA